MAEGRVRAVLADRPRALPELLGGPGRAGAGRVTKAMWGMRELDVQARQDA
ncbi:hypothetical protein [Streptomyces sp. ALB3]|uniref:hypothetical protein n=1 Tax=Streptomyces sp. ALB3 TaxID=3374278 RepID=UPI0037AE6639